MYTPERNRAQYGYAKPFDIYCWTEPGRMGCSARVTTVSYGDRALRLSGCAAQMPDRLKARLDDMMDAEDIRALLQETYGVPAAHTVKYVYRGTDEPSVPHEGLRTLTEEDFSAYRDFWRACHPGGQDGWLREYFDEMTAVGTCVGVYADGILASCTDTPGMPYMADKVQEIGVKTRPEYRRRGYAALACIRCAANILARGRCPQWSTDAGNHASRKLAACVGFEELADVVSVTL
ncbi:MAG: GNAT family N-acetyltransferase [Eubacteriales bacterium]